MPIQTLQKRARGLLHVARRERLVLLFSFACTGAIALTCLPMGTSFSKQNQKLIIYPQDTSSIRFDHARHSDLSCESCHKDVSKSTRAEERHAPDMDACTNACHTPSSKHAPLHECSSCHLRFDASTLTKEELEADPTAWRKASPAPMTSPAPQAALHFSHAAHATTDCATCHASSAGQINISSPSMSQCISCHTTRDAPTTCETCHLSGDLARLNPAPAPQRARLTPPLILSHEANHDAPEERVAAPESHTQGWLARHGIIALTERDDCLTCHTEQSCASCHNTQSGKPLAHHPQNYLITHRLSARQDTQDCTSCHRQETSCLGCHKDLMASPQTFPAQRDGFHPAGWLDASSSQNHGVMARRDINECASCHAEQDCVSCHQGISPHPPEWRTQCQQWLNQNAQACVKCHTQDALTTLCP